MHATTHKYAPGVPRVRVARVSDASAHDHVDKGDGRKPAFSTSENVGREVNLDLDVLLCAQPGEVATHEHVEVVFCMCGGRGRRGMHPGDRLCRFVQGE